MNPAVLILMIAGTGSLAKGFMDLPTTRTPKHHLRRERFHQHHVERSISLIALGVALLLAAIASGDWK